MTTTPTLQLAPPPLLDPERFLLFGAEGVGKTWAWFRMVEASGNRAYVLDTDRSVARFLYSPRWAHMRDRVEYETPVDWNDYVQPIKRWRKAAEASDWLIIDLVGRAWDEVQNHYVEEVFGVSRDEHMLTYRKHLESQRGKGSRSEFDATIDWPYVKGMYRSLTDNVLKWPGHVCLVAGKKSINDQFDDAGTKARYAPIGVKPDAEKTAGHLAHTLIYMAPNHRVTSLKDRERELLDGRKIDDMALGYLVGIAGWRPVA